MTQTEALKKARELVQRFVDCDGISSSDYLDVRDAIDEALAQPEHHTLTSRVNDVRLHKERDRQRAEAMKMLAQPEQKEPVAIVHRNEYNEYRLEPHDNFDIKSIPFNIDVPLFKSPQRTWVGLTDDEFNEISSKHSVATIKTFVQEIELKLKEKNT